MKTSYEKEFSTISVSEPSLISARVSAKCQAILTRPLLLQAMGNSKWQSTQELGGTHRQLRGQDTYPLVASEVVIFSQRHSKMLDSHAEQCSSITRAMDRWPWACVFNPRVLWHLESVFYWGLGIWFIQKLLFSSELSLPAKSSL